MAKNAIFSALILGILGILYWQGQLLQSGRMSGMSSSNPVSQKITVNTDKDAINVTQTIHHLNENHQYKIDVPNSILNWNCVKKDGKQPPDSKFCKPQSGILKIQYSLPITAATSSLLLTDWIMRLENVNIQNTRIELVDSVFRKGTWVASLPFKGSNKHKFIDFYVFEGKGENPSLYWQAKPLYNTIKNRYYSIYSTQKNKMTGEFSEVRFPNGLVYSVFIISDEHPPISSPGMYITNNPLSSLIYIDNRRVRINGEIASNLKVLVKNDELLFPFIQTMKDLGYNAMENQNHSEVLLKKNRKQFLFYYNQSSFIYNGQKYGLLANPFSKEDRIIYINSKGIHTLFSIKVSKSDREIQLHEK